MNTGHFRELIVRPTLSSLGLHSAEAEELLVATALHESAGLRWLAQRGGGPAKGVFQIEPATHDDIWESFLRFRPRLAANVAALAAPRPSRHDQLATNLAYGCAMARVHYLRVPEPLPAADDLHGLAAYWKAHYNTARGAGTVAAFIRDYRRYAA